MATFSSKKTLTSKQRMLLGMDYDATDAQLVKDRQACQVKLKEFNEKSIGLFDSVPFYRQLVRNLLPNADLTLALDWPFRCDYGYNVITGDNVRIGKNVYMMDAAPIYIGFESWIGPDCLLLTATHPIGARSSKPMLTQAKPIRIGDRTWLAAGVIVLPGVKIGRKCIIGAGSIIAHDVPDNTVIIQKRDLDTEAIARVMRNDYSDIPGYEDFLRMHQSDSTQQDLTQPDLTQAELMQPDLVQPASIPEPVPVTQPAMPEPVSQPDLTQPDMTQPNLTQPDLTQPDLAQPDLTQPDLAQPASIPEPVQPAQPVPQPVPQPASMPEPVPQPASIPEPVPQLVQPASIPSSNADALAKAGWTPAPKRVLNPNSILPQEEKDKLLEQQKLLAKEAEAKLQAGQCLTTEELMAIHCPWMLVEEPVDIVDGEPVYELKQ